MRVVEETREPEERDDGAELVKDEEGGYVGDGRVGEGGGVAVEEARESAVEAIDAGCRGRLDGRRRSGCGCRLVAAGWEMEAWTGWLSEEDATQHCGSW